MTKRNKNKSHQKPSKEQIFPSPQLSDVNPCNKLVARVENAQLDKHNIFSDAELLKEAEIKEESKKIIVDMIKEDFVSDFVIEPFDIQKSIDSADEGASTKKAVPELAFPGTGKSENPGKESKRISVASILSFGKKSSNKSSIKSRKSLDYSSSSSKNSFETLKTSASSSKTNSTPHEIISLIKKNKNGKFSSLLSTAASSVSSITTTSSSNTLSQTLSQNGKDASEIKTRRKNSPDTQSGKLQARTTSRELSAENPPRIAEIKTRRRITAFYAPPDYDFNALNTTTSHHANPMLLLAIPEIEDESSPNHTPEHIPSEDCPNQTVDLNDKVAFNSHLVNPTLLLTEDVLPPIHTPELSHFEDYSKQTVSLLNDVEGNDENLDGNFDDENSYRGFPVFSRIKKSGAYYNHALTQTSDTDSMFSDISEARVEWLKRYEDIDEISVNWDNLSGLQPYVDPFADSLGASSNDYYRRASLRRYHRNSMLSLNNRALPRSSYYGESNSPSNRSPPPAQHPSTKPVSPSHPSPTRSASPIHLPIPCKSNRRNSADSSSSSESAKRLSLQKLDLLLTDIEDFTNKVDDDDEKGNEKDTIVEEYVFEYLVTDCEDSDDSLKHNTTIASSVGSEFFTLTRNREIVSFKRDSDDDVIDMESLEGSPRNSFEQQLNDKTKYFSLVRRDRISQDGQVKYVSLLRQRKREDVVVDDEKGSKPLTKISNASAFKKKKNPVKRVYSIVRRRRNRVKEDERNEEKKSGRKSFLEGLNGLFKRKKIVVV